MNPRSISSKCCPRCRLETIRRPKRDEVQQLLTAIKSIADKFVEYEDYTVALTIYEVLVSEVIEHFNTFRDEYFAFCIILTGCMDGLDSCFADEDDQKVRLRVLRTLFAIYRFDTDSCMELDDDIPDLLVYNTTPDERQIIVGWVQDALTHMTGWNSSQPDERKSTTRSSHSMPNSAASSSAVRSDAV